MTPRILAFLAGAAVAAWVVSAWGAITLDEWLFAAAFLAAIGLCVLALLLDFAQFAIRSWLQDRRRRREADRYFFQVARALQHYFRHLMLNPPTRAPMRGESQRGRVVRYRADLERGALTREARP